MGLNMRKLKIIFAATLLSVFILMTGCTSKNSSETIVLQNRTSWSSDNQYIYAPDGYFVNYYEWIDVDENTKQLVIILSNNKEYGEK